MMKIKNAKLKIFAIIAALVAEAALVSCKKVQNFSEHKLSNGLTVFTAENHAVPLVYIEIAVKAGGVTQTKENAGLFHLYEHMMFKGNSLYPDAASVQRALSDMGCTNWNGTTGLNCVNYFITVPSDQLETGLAFWNAAIRSPLMKEDELEKEKKVVLSEIQGGLAEPGTIFSNYLISNLFPDEPYRLSPSGSADVVKDASVLQLRALQNKYYIPKNAALFVGGDIDEKEALNLIEKIWGSWSNNGNEA
ncbi:MAG: insulinase family protein, partial [Treponema sp.]|nr:insulinase family protein [Treponema sp.]